MKLLRQLHLYLGCVFATLLTLFIVTGAFQTFRLQENHKNGYVAPKILTELAAVHTDQKFSDDEDETRPSFPLKIFILIMSVGMFISVVLGIIMAFKFTKNPTLVWLFLAIGIILPVLFLVVAHKG